MDEGPRVLFGVLGVLSICRAPQTEVEARGEDVEEAGVFAQESDGCQRVEVDGGWDARTARFEEAADEAPGAVVEGFVVWVRGDAGTVECY